MKTTVLERTEPMNERLKAAAVLLVIALQIPLPASGQQAPAQGQTQPPGQTQAPPSATSAPLPPAKPAAQPRQLTLTPDYSAGRFFFPYTPRQVAEPMLTNSPRIDQLIQNGKLMLSLEDTISLALENNMDIAVQRFTPWLDETALLRSLSGVNGRLVFDPVVTGTSYISKASTPINNPFLAGVNITNRWLARGAQSHHPQRSGQFHLHPGLFSGHPASGNFQQHPFFRSISPPIFSIPSANHSSPSKSLSRC